jgi:hypothetical protein
VRFRSTRFPTTEEVELRAGPLTGCRIADLSGAMGAYCTKLLANLSADVIEVEPRSTPAIRPSLTARSAGNAAAPVRSTTVPSRQKIICHDSSDTVGRLDLFVTFNQHPGSGTPRWSSLLTGAPP